MRERAEIFEVGPRDGLQNEAGTIPTGDKIALIDLLGRAGYRRIEAASFVSPKWVPQMADGAEVLAGIARVPGISYAALTPNLKGFERAMAARADEVAIFASASEGFSRANLNCSINESFNRFQPIISAANVRKVKVRGYVSCIVDCPWDGPTPPESVAGVVERLLAMGCYEVSLGDTLGRARPEAVAALLERVLEVADAAHLAGHFHDTAGRALGNVTVALECGIRAFDAAIGGLGGCPYAPGAAGNVASERLRAHLETLGFATGLDAQVMEKAAEMARAMRQAARGEADVQDH